MDISRWSSYESCVLFLPTGLLPTAPLTRNALHSLPEPVQVGLITRIRGPKQRNVTLGSTIGCLECVLCWIVQETTHSNTHYRNAR